MRVLSWWVAGAQRVLGRLAAAWLCLALSTGFVLASEPPLTVVATFSIVADMAKVIGGDRIELITLLGPDADMHAYEPAPRDVQSLAKADIVLANGLNFEPWLSRVLASSGFDGELVKVSNGITPRVLTAEEQLEHLRKHHSGRLDAHTHDNGSHGQQDHDEAADEGALHHHAPPGIIDPHAWQSLSNGIVYARNIAKALARLDPASAADYRIRCRKYIEQMQRLDKRIREKLDKVPPEQRRVITAHDAFGYFGDAYDVKFTSLMGLSSEAEPSAGTMAQLVDEIRAQPGAVVFIERTSNPRLAEQIARETGAIIGGTLYSDALGKPDEPGGSYLGMFSWNAGQIIDALRSDEAEQKL